jgi:hypothetical protein
MSYLDTLIDTKNNVENGIELPVNQKLIIIELIESRQVLEHAKDDALLYFYSDVISSEEVFDYASVLDNLYADAKTHAQACLTIYNRFSQIQPCEDLNNWLSSAIRTVDCIAIHYLQNVMQEEPRKQGEAGWERSKYIQINRLGVRAGRAGRIMDDLYEERNKMEHRTKNDPANPGRRILITPKFNKIIKKIKKRFPEALVCFNDAFKEHYDV